MHTYTIRYTLYLLYLKIDIKYGGMYYALRTLVKYTNYSVFLDNNNSFKILMLDILHFYIYFCVTFYVPIYALYA